MHHLEILVVGGKILLKFIIKMWNVKSDWIDLAPCRDKRRRFWMR